MKNVKDKKKTYTLIVNDRVMADYKCKARSSKQAIDIIIREIMMGNPLDFITELKLEAKTKNNLSEE